MSGDYHLRSLALAAGSRVEALGPIDLRVAETLRVGDGAAIGPAEGAAIGAGDVRVEVSGAGAEAAVLGRDHDVRAVLLAARGAIKLGGGSLVGAAIADSISTTGPPVIWRMRICGRSTGT